MKTKDQESLINGEVCKKSKDCSTCLFFRPTYLYYHYWTKHPRFMESSNDHRCEKCGIVCFDEDLLQLHNLRHEPWHILHNEWINDSISHVFEDEIYKSRLSRCTNAHYKAQRREKRMKRTMSDHLCHDFIKGDGDCHPPESVYLNPIY